MKMRRRAEPKEDSATLVNLDGSCYGSISEVTASMCELLTDVIKWVPVLQLWRRFCSQDTEDTGVN